MTNSLETGTTLVIDCATLLTGEGVIVECDDDLGLDGEDEFSLECGDHA